MTDRWSPSESTHPSTTMSQQTEQQQSKAIRNASVYPVTILAAYFIGLAVFGSILINGFGH